MTTGMEPTDQELHALEGRVERLTQMLSGLCAEVSRYPALHPIDIFEHEPGLLVWWNEHQRKDAERETADEEGKCRREAARVVARTLREYNFNCRTSDLLYAKDIADRLATKLELEASKR